MSGADDEFETFEGSAVVNFVLKLRKNSDPNAEQVNPTWLSSGAVTAVSGRKLSHQLQATSTEGGVTFGPFTGVDVNQLDTFADQLKWEYDGARYFSFPQDADANNVYVGEISATDSLGRSTTLAHTITLVANVDEPAQITDFSVTPGTTTATLVFTNSPGATYHEYALDGTAAQLVPGDKILTGLVPGSPHSAMVRGVKNVGGTLNYGRFAAPAAWTQGTVVTRDTITHEAQDEIDRSTYDFASVDVGALSADGFTKTGIYVHVHTQLAATVHQHGTLRVTPQGSAEGVGAVAGVRVAQITGAITASLWRVPYTDDDLPNIRLIARNSGDTADVAVNRAQITVRPIYGRTLVPIGTGSDQVAPIEINAVLPDAGLAIMSAMAAAGTDETCSWPSGVLKENDGWQASMVWSVAQYESDVAAGETKNIAPAWTGTPATERIVGAWLGPPVASPSGIQAVWSDDFVDSQGINIHLNWQTTGLPEQYATRNLWLSHFGDLGIRYVRSALPNTDPNTLGLHDILFNTYGVKYSLVLSRFNPHTGLADIPGMRIDVDNYRVRAEQVLALEGANEVNSYQQGVGFGDWAANTVALQSAYQTRIRGYPEYNNAVILAPSVYGRSDRAMRLLMEAGMTPALFDVNVGHNYTGGRRPSEGAVPIAGNENGGSGTITAERFMHFARVMKPAAPLWVTEEGYEVVGGGVPAGVWEISHRAQAVFNMRLFFEHFLRRLPGANSETDINQYCQKTWLYTTHDNLQVADNYGIWEPIMGGGVMTSMNLRTCHTAIKNLNAFLTDGGGPGGAVRPTLGSLNLSIAGNMADIKYILMQKRPGGSTGKYILATYLDAHSWNRVTPYGDISPLPTRSLTFDFGQVPSAILRTATPLSSGAWSNQTASRTITLAVPDHPLLIEFTP